MGIERVLGATAGLATPALVVDLVAADANLAAANVRLRPHLKAHKCPELMRRQLKGGDCTGVTCATPWEAEVAARAGLHHDILVANEVADPGGLESLRRAAELARITVAIDGPRHLELLQGIDCDVLIEINVGQDRCGLDPADEAAILALAERAGERFRGLQGYEGHAVLLPERPSREEQVERAAAILNRLRSVLDCELVSGGGTGTYDLSTHLDEIQAGSYVLMDASYDKLDLPFALALACRTTVVSRNGTRAVCDAGLKALSAEYGLPRALAPGIEVVGLADEHATLQLAPDSPLEVGDAILLIPAHVDPTVNLHAALHAVEADGTVHRWPVAAARTAAPAP
jgi:D-serine deaminase-like pyridoxal phosphate-dependent protein